MIHEDEVVEIFNKEIVRELLRETNPDVSDEDVEKIWATCAGNPWNAEIMHAFLKLAAQDKISKP